MPALPLWLGKWWYRSCIWGLLLFSCPYRVWTGVLHTLTFRLYQIHIRVSSAWLDHQQGPSVVASPRYRVQRKNTWGNTRVERSCFYNRRSRKQNLKYRICSASIIVEVFFPIFISDGWVGVAAVIRVAEWHDLAKITETNEVLSVVSVPPHSVRAYIVSRDRAINSFIQDGVCSRKQKPTNKRRINQSQFQALWLIGSLASTVDSSNLVFEVFTRSYINDGVVNEIVREWKRSDFSDSDSAELMKLLMTPLMKPLRALTAPTTSPLPALSAHLFTSHQFKNVPLGVYYLHLCYALIVLQKINCRPPCHSMSVGVLWTTRYITIVATLIIVLFNEMQISGGVFCS